MVETGANTNIFRNFAPVVLTNAGIDPVPVAAPFYIQVPKAFVSAGQNPTVTLSAKLEDGTRKNLAVVPLVDAPVAGFLRSAKPLLVVPEGAELSQMPAGAANTYQTVSWPLLAQVDWKQGGGFMRIQNEQENSVEVPVVTNGVVLQSFPAGLTFTPFGGPGDSERLIREPLTKMKFAIEKDYHASIANTLSKYIKNKSIVYAFCHGAVDGGGSGLTIPGENSQAIIGDFAGLSFCDSDTAGIITASKVAAARPNCRLVICDACTSARTTARIDASSPPPAFNRKDAQDSNEFTSGSAAFAEAFGPDAAYVGWSWAESITLVQPITSDLLKFLAKGSTVQQARDLVVRQHITDKTVQELKVYLKNNDVRLISSEEQ